MSYKADNVINDASFTTVEDDTNNIRTSTLWDAEEQTDGIADYNNNGSYEALPAKTPPAATAGTRSTYYASFHQSGTEEHINNNTTFVNQQPPLSTTTSKRAANEYEQLLSSTIFSLLEKFVPALQKQRLSPSKNNECSSDGGLDIPAGGDNYCQSTTAFNDAEEFDNFNSNEGDGRMSMLLDVESQSFENNNNNTPPYSNNEMKTPKMNNLKTTGLEEEFDDAAVAHNQQHQRQQRKDSTSTTSEYLPQSAAKLLNTLQHTNFDRGAEEIMLSILSSNSSGSLDDGSSSSFNEDDDHHEGDDGKTAVNAAKLPPVTTFNDQDGTITNRHNSFESSSNNQQQQYNYDDDDFDDTSLSGDMARLSTSIAHLQRDLDNIDMSQFETICLEDEQQHDTTYGSGRGNRWKSWIRKWLLSHGIVNDEKVLNHLLRSGTTNGGDDIGSNNITPGRGGFTIFDFERDYMLVLVLLLVFFVLLRNRFQTLNELLFEDENRDLFGGSSDW